MPAQITAITDRGASGRVPAVCLSPTLVESSRWPVSPADHRRDRADDGPAVDLSKLHTGQLAIALNVAGLPVRSWKKLTNAQLADLATAGIAAVGLAEVVHRDEQARAAVRAAFRRRDLDPSDGAEDEWARVDRVFGSARMYRAASDAANHLLDWIKPLPPRPVDGHLFRCLTCGQVTNTRHPDCKLPTSGVWVPCQACAGSRLVDGVECDTCCGVGFIDELAVDTLAERSGDLDEVIA